MVAQNIATPSEVEVCAPGAARGAADPPTHFFRAPRGFGARKRGWAEREDTPFGGGRAAVAETRAARLQVPPAGEWRWGALAP